MRLIGIVIGAVMIIGFIAAPINRMIRHNLHDTVMSRIASSHSQQSD